MSPETGIQSPKEALAYWRGKAPVGEQEYAALGQAARSRAFAVSGLAAGDLLSDVYLSLDRALERGESLATWKKGLGAQLEQLGWTGPAAYRASLVFRTNMQMAFQAGRWAQIQETKNALPILVYSAVNDSRTRPTHRAMHGMAFPIDHEFWRKFYPPNGYQCRCTARPMSREQAAALDLEVRGEIPEVVETPNGLVRIAPDQGWSGNVGQDWLTGLSPRPADGPVKDLVSRAWCPELRGKFADDPCRPALATLDRRHLLPVREGDIITAQGMTPERYAMTFLREFGITDLDGSATITIPGTPLPVVISKDLFIDKASGEFKSDKSGRGPYVRLLARTILDPYEVWWVPATVSGKRRTCLRLIRLFEGARGKVGGFGVFNLIGGRLWQGATVYPPKVGSSAAVMIDYLERQRVGTLLYREEAN